MYFAHNRIALLPIRVITLTPGEFVTDFLGVLFAKRKRNNAAFLIESHIPGSGRILNDGHFIPPAADETADRKVS